ncbi:hypothetical protein RM572_08525 [Streptomyces sp. DSM 42041]|uniref:UTRA domain-containing protein n=2 Tax=Streptomyces hazeniae TaxID=3075538 RepID=A0ABU2NRF9_9ACTN|nr:hypothetical protein [Streptomyces sp. DSM 42041]MDT0378818.1 hypothetical protein [Streptomyces sp. DSM 42041]
MIPIVGRQDEQEAPRPRRPGFGLRGPRSLRHRVAVEELAAIGVPLGDDGVVIGTDAQNQTAVLGLSRRTAYDLLLIGGLWTAQVLALRAAGTGARVAVETGRAHVWTPLAQAAGAEQQCITLHDVGHVPSLGPSVSSPVVVIRDCGMKPPRGRVNSAPWQAVVTLLPYLSPAAPRLLQTSSLVGIQRVSPDEARHLSRKMRLPQEETESLPTLGDGVTLWCTRKDRYYSVTQPTDAEVGLLGHARRLD